MLNYQVVFTGASVLPYSMYLILFVDQYQTTEREPAELLLITYHQASSTREGFHAFPCFFQGKKQIAKLEAEEKAEQEAKEGGAQKSLDQLGPRRRMRRCLRGVLGGHLMNYSNYID